MDVYFMCEESYLRRPIRFTKCRAANKRIVLPEKRVCHILRSI